MYNQKRIFRIDLCPSEENGLWIVRQDIHIEGDKWEEIGELQFGTEKEADAFIDRWIAKQKPKTKQPKKEKPLDLEMSQALWNTVSCAIECGGLGGGAWGWEAKEGWKAYNDAKGKDYLTLTITCRMHDFENEIILTPWVDMSTAWLHTRMKDFVADQKQPNWIRVQYAGMLATRDNPPEEDAVTGDAFLQYAFLNEIRFG